jgi:hypothetical protein
MHKFNKPRLMIVSLTEGARIKRVSALLGLCGMLALAVWTAPAGADPNSGPPICSSAGTPVSGNYYRSLTLTGNNHVAAGKNLAVRGDLRIAPGGCLDAYSTGTVEVGQNLLVGENAILGLGCAPGVDFLPVPCGSTTTNDTIGGDLLAFDPYTMYLTADTIRGSLLSFGGGPGVTSNPYVNFPIKDNIIHGNAVIDGWNGTWFGFLRNVVQGSVVVANINTADPDSSEVVTNNVRHDLSCYRNTPAVQFGDSGGSPNKVRGFAFGECGFNVMSPDINYGGGGPQPISVMAP